jgi:HK97 family phage major capsid protein
MSASATPEQGMTKGEVVELIKSTAAEALGPVVSKALEPFSEAQKGLIDKLRGPAAEGDPNVFDEKSLGKYPYGRKARALAMAALENGSQEIGAAATGVKRHWAPTHADATLKWLKWAEERISKGLTVGNAATAGDMVFPEYDTEWIELLRNNAVVRGLCRTVPMPRGATSRRKQTGASTATYQGELGPIVDSSQTVGRINLSYKKLTGATVVSNDLLRFAGSEADRFVQEDLLRVSALREDRAFLVGNPPTDAGSPQGIRFQTAAANIAASAGASLANFQSDLTSLVSLVQKNNIGATPANSGFIMSVSTFWTIYALTTTTGDWVFASGLAAGQPRILGFPVYLTTQLEVSNSWIGASAGLVGFVHWPSMEIHDSMSRTVEVFRGGAYRDSSGTIQSGISNDETVITCIAEHDFFQAYDVAAAFKTGYAT